MLKKTKRYPSRQPKLEIYDVKYTSNRLATECMR